MMLKIPKVQEDAFTASALRFRPVGGSEWALGVMTHVRQGSPCGSAAGTRVPKPRLKG